MAENPSFITENPGQAAETEGSNNESSDAEYEAVMEGPRENASRLFSVAKSLNEKMRGLLEKEKEEFIAAYRAHTRKVQEDLARLRQRVAEEEESLHRDEKVNRLQRERDTFRTEALALDAGNAQLAKDLEVIRSKLEVLEDDRNFLVRQMKARSKNEGSPRPENDETSNPDSPQCKQATTHRGLRSLESPAADTNKRQQFLPPIGGGGRTGILATQELEDQDQTSVKALRRELQGLKGALALERRQLETMSREVGLVQARRESNWLEALLLDCVRAVVADVAQRRTAAEAARGHTRRSSSGAVAEGVAASLSSVISEAGGGGLPQQVSLAADAWGEAPLRLDLLTAVDRCSVLRKFVSDPRVQQALAKRRQESEFQAASGERTSPGGQDREDEFSADTRGDTLGSRGKTPTRVSWIGASK